MHLHILGICGTFMGGLALLARELGYRVTGSDANVYPPMSTQLEAAGIELSVGYEDAHLRPAPDLILVGNAMTRGIAAVEYMLDRGMPYMSGPQWLAEAVLADRHVLAVSGTHGKTTTSSMLAWILESAGLQPGFLIGGVPSNFGSSARLGGGRPFVVEADEYDTAFFDKRSKFVHYRPRTLVINNLEFDHADIFADLAAIQRQFHHLVRTVPQSGLILHPVAVESIEEVLAMGCWTPCEGFALAGETGAADAPTRLAEWSARLVSPNGSQVELRRRGRAVAEWSWTQTGRHNVTNAMAAMAAAAHVGVEVEDAARALERFDGVRRRMELRGEFGGVRLYDDFAHHPTAIATTLDGLRQTVGQERILAILEPRSNTMRAGVHAEALPGAFTDADLVFVLAPPDLGWDLEQAFAPLAGRVRLFDSIDSLVAAILEQATAGDHLLVMSNGGFQGIHQRLLDGLSAGQARED